MSDLKLVAPDQPTPLERLLLDAAANEAPSAEQRIRVRAALGLSVMTVPPPPAARVGRIATFGKVAIGGVVAASAIALLVLAGVGRKSAPAPHAGSAAPIAAPSVPAKPALGNTAEPVASPLPPVEPASDSPAAGSSAAKSAPKSVASTSGLGKTPAPADSAADLSEQLRLIDAARAAVAAGNASAASQALASYGAKFPHGSFGQEAAVLRIETFDLQGNHAQATALARSFLAQHPNSPHVSLVQRIANRGQ
ncbi:MAG TPA: outer membrane protein assembly factor BamD [Polyangiaceae bacterium]|jgi:hypothetical protein|nr:outer membrane protein assembly factor BamD [Polyangiaceae bacterium]